ncbi:MAG: ABC transporter substrate-binding protein [Desulfobacteraceae bacterium]|jgi:branched-chain amino acid transport system substrate-binding protein
MGTMEAKKPFLVRVLLLSLSLTFLLGGSVYAAGGDPVVFGVPTALGSIEGRDGWMAIQMAVEEINAKGGILVGGEKRPLKAYSIDTREHEPGIPVHDALTAVEKLILEKKPHAIVLGAFRSEILMASMDLVSKYKLPYICSIAMTPAYQKKIVQEYDKYKYFFRNCLNAIYLVKYLQGVMGFLNKEFGFNKAYLALQDTLWAKATGKGLQKWYEKQGWEVTGSDAFPLGASDFSSTLIKVRAKKAQVVVPIFDMPQSGILLKQARAMRIPSLLCGFISPVAPGDAWEVFEQEVEGMVNFLFEIGPIPVKAVPKSVEFNTNFGKRWGEKARVQLSGHGPGPSYDAVYIMADAITRAGSLDPDAIVSALEKTDMNGVVGRIKFGKDHQVIYGLDPKETALGCAFQWVKPGVRVPVFPEVVAEAKIQLPSYMK